MHETIRHRLPLMAAAQAQKEITHNEALMLVDRLLHPVVESRALAVPPAMASPGAAWIVAAGAADAWAGAEGRLAVHDGEAWHFAEPFAGLATWVRDEHCFVAWDDGWSDTWPVGGLSIRGRRVLDAAPAAMAPAVGGTVVDAELRAVTATLIEALRAQGIVT
ncbi:hypothetical protein GCM10007973_02620 [Polymorphobacter multimanifer]|uniref:DUF2793 domain-containing protein n=1 Tax=Polymorphobacter multimanifer TaxID=1070431 RepID=A0A841L2U9_9SPHN|nr:DUF2793 domain-containing protein [Polymorphobacter multimanifer]MBB6226626.1 hypothetical protein [Polymorphobacter multimanifer]GGI69013.1 hypothetical protein GCM10007973_02620 [Polymorphobacter multimanifer]